MTKHGVKSFEDKQYDSTLIVETWADGKVTLSVEGRDREAGVQLGQKRVGKLYDLLGAALIREGAK